MFDWLQLIMMLGALQGTLSVIAINTIQNRNKRANKTLSLLIAFLVIALVGRVHYDSDWAKELMAHIGWLFDSLIFLYGPLLYHYITQLLFIPQEPRRFPRKQVLLYTLPLAFFLLYISIQQLEWGNWLEITLANQKIDLGFIFIALLATTHILYFLTISFNTIRYYETQKTNHISYSQYRGYLKTTIILTSICFVLMIYNGFAYYFQFYSPFYYLDYNLLWITITFLSFSFAFFAIYQPALFKLPSHTLSSHQKLNSVMNHNHAILLKKLNQLMEGEKLYLNSLLSLSDLAQQMDINKVELSQLINQAIGKNFYDYINAFRIQEFIKIAQHPKKQHLTHLCQQKNH